MHEKKNSPCGSLEVLATKAYLPAVAKLHRTLDMFLNYLTALS